MRGAIGRGLAPYPQAQPEGRFAPLCGIAQADLLAGADQRGSALELLQREQTQRVPHQHRYTVFAVAPARVLLQPPHRHGVSRESQVGFRLAAAGGKPQQVRTSIGPGTAVGVIETGEPRQVDQDEGQLKGVPTAVFRNVHVSQLPRGVLLPSLDPYGPHALLPHGAVGETKRLARVSVGSEQRDRLFQPA